VLTKLAAEHALPKDLLQSDYIVAIENYIEQSPVTGRWYDKGLVLVKDQVAGKDIVLASQAVFIPEQYVVLAQQMSSEFSELGFSTTVGVAIKQSFPDRNIDPTDWHKEVEFGGVSRMQFLTDTLSKALYVDELIFLN
jgi:hypothetical protein